MRSKPHAYCNRYLFNRRGATMYGSAHLSLGLLVAIPMRPTELNYGPISVH